MLQFNTFSNLEVVFRWCGVSAMACLASSALWVLVEQPCMTIFSPSKNAARNPKGANNNSKEENKGMQEAEQSGKAIKSLGSINDIETVVSHHSNAPAA